MSGLNDIVILLNLYGSLVKASLFMPLDVFKNEYEQTVHDSNNNISSTVKYISDTSIEICVDNENWYMQFYCR